MNQDTHTCQPWFRLLLLMWMHHTTIFQVFISMETHLRILCRQQWHVHNINYSSIKLLVCVLPKSFLTRYHMPSNKIKLLTRKYKNKRKPKWIKILTVTKISDIGSSMLCGDTIPRFSKFLSAWAHVEFCKNRKVKCSTKDTLQPNPVSAINHTSKK